MMDRSRACSSLVALAIASVGVLSACEQGKPQDVTQKLSALTTGLQPGDVAVTCMFTTNDQLQIVPLVSLDVGSDVKYTDREANAAGQFNTGENVDVVYPINSPNDASTIIPAGTVLPFGPTSVQPSFPGGLGDGTEQVFLYQGLIATVDGGAPSDQLLWGMQVSPGGIWVATRDDTNNLSELPTVLTGFNVSLASGTSTNYAYDSTKGTSGTKAQLQAKIANPANWVQGTAAAPITCPTGFTVIPDPTDAGGGTDSAGQGGAGGAGGSDGGIAGMTGTTDGGTDSVADTGAGGTTGDGSVADTGVGGATGGDGSVIDAGVGGAGGALDSGTDVKADTGTTDVKADTATDTATGTDAKTDTGTDVKADTGTGTDAKVDTGTGTDVKPADAGKDSATTSSSSGCSCSTASNGQSLSASVSLLALAGIVMTARRRRRR